MKMIRFLGIAIFLVAAQVSLSVAGEVTYRVGYDDGPLPPGVTIKYGNEAQEIAAGRMTYTVAKNYPCDDPVVSASSCTQVAGHPQTAPTHSFHPVTNSSQVVTQVVERIIEVEKKKCSGWKHFWNRCGCRSLARIPLSASVSASASIYSAGPTYYPSYWERNDSYYESVHYGTPYYPDTVFHYGAIPYRPTSVVSYGPGYTFVDTYRGSGPYAPVRFIPDPQRGHQAPRYCPPRQAPPPRNLPHHGGGNRGRR